jgi:hypothetical protein
MNMQAFNFSLMRKLLLPIIPLVLLSLTACKKETFFTYEVEDVDVSQPGAVKPNVKSDLEFISIAHTELFGATISPSDLQDLALAYQSIGDKRLAIDMIILNFLNSPGLQIPSATSMRADVEAFVNDCFRKFYVRDPSAFEKWFVVNQIEENTDITPVLVWYAFMTSQEYRFY